MRANVPPDFFCVVDAVQTNQQVNVGLVLAPRTEVIRNAGARKAPEDGGAKRFQARIAAHPKRRAGGKRQKMRQKIARHVHQVDHGGAVGNGHVNVHAENQERASQLLQLFDNILIAITRRDHLVNPTGEWVSAGGGNLQANSFGGPHQFPAGAPHIGGYLDNVPVRFRADFDDRLVHLGLDLLAQARRSGGNEFAYVRTQFTRGRVNDLKLFLDTYGEPVIHGRPFRSETRGFRRLSYAKSGGITWIAKKAIRRGVAGTLRLSFEVAKSRIKTAL